MNNDPILLPIYYRIGIRLRCVRQTRNEKLETVERATGINHGVISKIENGRYHSLSFKMIGKLVTYYGISIDNITAP